MFITLDIRDSKFDMNSVLPTSRDVASFFQSRGFEIDDIRVQPSGLVHLTTVGDNFAAISAAWEEFDNAPVSKETKLSFELQGLVNKRKMLKTRSLTTGEETQAIEELISVVLAMNGL